MIFKENGKNRQGILIKCKNCNKEFVTRKDKPNFCCSKNCKYLISRNRIDVNCANCGKIFEKKLSHLNNSKSGLYFCNRKCKDKAQKLGGIKEIMPSHYGTSEISNKTFIESIENPQCAGCGENKIYLLCVHHIDGNHDNNIKENFEIVCGNCHIKRHLKFNKIENTWIYHCASLTPRNLLNEL